MHGTFKGELPRKGHEGGGGATLSLVLRILLREAAVGVLLFLTLGIDGRRDAFVCAVMSAGLVLLTHSRSLLGRKDAMGLLTECVVIFCGALAVRYLLVLLPTLLAARH